MKKCPKCNNVYFNNFNNCPNCGTPLRNAQRTEVSEAEEREDRSYSPMLFIGIGIVLCAVAMIAINIFTGGTTRSGVESAQSQEQQEQYEALAEEEQEDPAEEEEETEEVPEEETEEQIEDDSEAEVETEVAEVEAEVAEEEPEAADEPTPQGNSTSTEDTQDAEDEVEDEPLAQEVIASAVSMSSISSVTATSNLDPITTTDGTFTYTPDKLIDGNLSTAWCEGVSGNGRGESVTIIFDNTYLISGFNIYAGYQKSNDIFYKNGRPKTIEVKMSGGESWTLSFSDSREGNQFTLPKQVEANWIRFTIGDVYSGSKYEDTAISEIEVY